MDHNTSFQTTDGAQRIAPVGLPRTTANHQILRGFVEHSEPHGAFEVGTTLILRAAFDANTWDDQDHAQRRTLLKREVEYAALIAHELQPHLLEIRLSNNETDTVMATRLLGAARLGRHIRANYPSGAPIELGLRWIREVVTSLDVLHDQDLIHRNVNPDNILISEGDDPKATLIGFASIQLQNSRPSPLIDGVHERFTAPEILHELGGTYMRPQADVYSIGALIAYVFTGEDLTKSPEAPVTAHAWSQLAAHPDGIRLLIARCMEPRQQDRFKNAREILPWLHRETLPTTSTEGFQSIYLESPWIGSGDESKIGHLSPGPLVSRSPQQLAQSAPAAQDKGSKENDANAPSEESPTHAAPETVRTADLAKDGKKPPFFARWGIPPLTIIFITIILALIVLYLARALGK